MYNIYTILPDIGEWNVNCQTEVGKKILDSNIAYGSY